eukprot:TRINITY_DN8920_c0_g1_i1.p1 TRINITY_DN8920_c0_g1~~TRINITY_DN8920_c0_g1_i1.p1  ORF type:complete len:217 (-),score=101.30 TRINITY_DN8920_c0_g1_i1:1071-1721(-)
MADANVALEAKVVLLGDTGVGKTSMAMRFTQETFLTHVNSTIGASFFSKTIWIDAVRIKMMIWDTAGQERFRSLAPMYYKGASAALLVFDVTNEFSFERVKEWNRELRSMIIDEIAVAIVGNQADREEARQVSSAEAADYAASIGSKYFECSARSNLGIDDVFNKVARQLLDMHQAATKDHGHGTEVSSNILSVRAVRPSSLTDEPPKKKKDDCRC